ncbi:MAG: methionine synthase [Actinomycetia bacterium]|nr:methionine synthase [Actinomycetes bacterium]
MSEAVGTTGIGSWPGDRVPDAVRQVLELWDLPFLPELPGRGPAAEMVGRSLALLPEPSFELGRSGWRVSGRPGRDQRRAAALLRADLDQLAEAAAGYTGRLVVSLAGPWTLMSCVDLPRGGKVLGDPGARRDLVVATTEAVDELVGTVARLVPGAEVCAKLDEPALGAVLAGSVPTESGLYRHPPLPVDEVRAGLRELVARRPELVVHSCAPVPVGLLSQCRVATVALDAALAGSLTCTEVGEHLDRGGSLWLGIVPTGPGAAVPSVAEVTARTLAWLRPLELGERLLGRLWLTPACGLAGFSVPDAQAVAQVLRQAAKAVTDSLAG